MGTQSIYEIWEKDGSGVLSVEPLILTACKEGKIGSVFPYPGGAIYKTIFTYLCGKPDEAFLAENPNVIYNSRLVCMSPAWEEYIRKLPIKFILRRELMKPLRAASDKKLPDYLRRKTEIDKAIISFRVAPPVALIKKALE